MSYLRIRLRNMHLYSQPMTRKVKYKNRRFGKHSAFVSVNYMNKNTFPHINGKIMHRDNQDNC